MTDFIPSVIILHFHLSLSSIPNVVKIFFLRGQAFGLSNLESDGKWDSGERRLLAKMHNIHFLKLVTFIYSEKEQNLHANFVQRHCIYGCLKSTCKVMVLAQF